MILIESTYDKRSLGINPKIMAWKKNLGRIIVAFFFGETPKGTHGNNYYWSYP